MAHLEGFAGFTPLDLDVSAGLDVEGDVDWVLHLGDRMSAANAAEGGLDNTRVVLRPG